jgi:hypothetical protein
MKRQNKNFLPSQSCKTLAKIVSAGKFQSGNRIHVPDGHPKESLLASKVSLVITVD